VKNASINFGYACRAAVATAADAQNLVHAQLVWMVALQSTAATTLNKEYVYAIKLNTLI